MVARKRKRRPNQGAPPRHNVERFAAARAQGKTLAEAVTLAGRSPEGSTEDAARKAGARMEKHPEVREAIQRHKRDLIKAMAKKQVADLWPAALNTLETLLHDPSLSHTNQLRAVELVARMTGNLTNETGVQVQVLQIGEQARAELRQMQGSEKMQSAALDELQRMTLNAQAKIEDTLIPDTLPVQVELELQAMDAEEEPNGVV